MIHWRGGSRADPDLSRSRSQPEPDLSRNMIRNLPNVRSIEGGGDRTPIGSDLNPDHALTDWHALIHQDSPSSPA